MTHHATSETPSGAVIVTHWRASVAALAEAREEERRKNDVEAIVRQVEEDPDRAAQLGTKRPRDHEIRPAAPHVAVRDDGGPNNGAQTRNKRAYQNAYKRRKMSAKIAESV